MQSVVLTMIDSVYPSVCLAVCVCPSRSDIMYKIMTQTTININYFRYTKNVSQITVIKQEWGGWNRRICSFPDAI